MLSRLLRVLANAAAGLSLSNSNEIEVRDCIVADNGTTGIAVGENSLIVGNRVTGNGGFGIVMGAGSGYGGNLIGNNTGGTASGGVQMGTNVCNGNTTCP